MDQIEIRRSKMCEALHRIAAGSTLICWTRARRWSQQSSRKSYQMYPRRLECKKEDQPFTPKLQHVGICLNFVFVNLHFLHIYFVRNQISGVVYAGDIVFRGVWSVLSLFCFMWSSDSFILFLSVAKWAILLGSLIILSRGLWFVVCLSTWISLRSEAICGRRPWCRYCMASLRQPRLRVHHKLWRTSCSMSILVIGACSFEVSALFLLLNNDLVTLAAWHVIVVIDTLAKLQGPHDHAPVSPLPSLSAAVPGNFLWHRILLLQLRSRSRQATQFAHEITMHGGFEKISRLPTFDSLQVPSLPSSFPCQWSC